jgi:hypothetical protein
LLPCINVVSSAGVVAALVAVAACLATARLRVVPTGLAALVQLDRSLNGLIRRWPELQEVRIDLTALDALGDEAIAALKRAIATISDSGVRVMLEGYSLRMLQALVSHGVSAEHLGNLRRLPPGSVKDRG